MTRRLLALDRNGNRLSKEGEPRHAGSRFLGRGAGTKNGRLVGASDGEGGTELALSSLTGGEQPGQEAGLPRQARLALAQPAD